MALWSLSGSFKDVCFLCVCVDPNALGTAADFSRNYFNGASSSLWNGFIDNRADFPTFQAQLGCQGFIIFDGAGQIKVPKSAQWNQDRERAMRMVEGQLRAILPKAQVPVGRKVRVVGLGSTKGLEINGRLGEVLGASGPDRWSVQVVGEEKPMALRPENLEEGTDEPNETQSDDEDATVASVNHEGMDRDHEECTDALRGLLQSLCKPSLRKARAAIADHFEREEALLREEGFGEDKRGKEESGGMFSAMDNHIKDHQRIVALADDALGNLDGACDSVQGSVPKVVAKQLARAFREHADLYDSLYAEKFA